MEAADSASSPLLVTSDGPVRVVTLNRPQSLNAMDAALHRELTRVWSSLADDPDARAVVLTAQGNAFSAGGDLDYFRVLQNDRRERHRSMREARSLATGLLEFPLPVVAAVRGAAVGVGCTVALLCDLMVMEESAYLLDPHLRVGLVAGDGGATLWPFVTTPQKTKQILFLAGRVTPQDAESMGLANRVAPDGEGLSTALALAHRLAEVPQGA